MNNKEKLTEVLKNNVYLQPSSIADYLLDNGVVPVVRYCECKRRESDGFGQPNILCWQMHDDDYCSYGERKDND